MKKLVDTLKENALSIIGISAMIIFIVYVVCISINLHSVIIPSISNIL